MKNQEHETSIPVVIGRLARAAYASTKKDAPGETGLELIELLEVHGFVINKKVSHENK